MSTADQTAAIFEAFAAHDIECYVVGGTVRDQILGRPISDIDFSVATLPEHMEAILAEAGIRTVRTGFDHGTITALVGDAAFEITAFRRDVKTDGRHAITEYGGTLDDDAMRRDFTMNALYQMRDGSIIDPFAGVSDVTAKTIRFIGNADARIREDYLRILRYFRFIAQLSFDGVVEDQQAIRDNASGLDQISGERIGQEMKKLLASPEPVGALQQMFEFGVARYVLEPVNVERLRGLLPFVLGDWHAVLVAASDETPARWKLSNAEKRRIKNLRTIMGGGDGAVQLGYRYGAVDATIGLRLRLTRELNTIEHTEIIRGANATFPIKGKDLIPIMDAGPLLGETLDRMKDYWLENDLHPTQEELLALL